MTNLCRSLDLTKYESSAYVALLTKEEISPSELAKASGVPRSRAYDVLRTLVRKGLATERLQKPLRYAAVDPRIGLYSLSAQIEEDAKSNFAKKRAVVGVLTDELGTIYENFRYMTGSEQKVSVGTTSSWKQLESLKAQTQNEYVGVSLSATVPPYSIFAQEEKMLERGIKMKLIRPFPAEIRRRHIDWYLRLMRKGFEIRSSEDIEFSFDISDATSSIIWLNDRADHPPTEAVWFQHVPLARILRENFEMLWRSATPAQNILRKRIA